MLESEPFANEPRTPVDPAPEHCVKQYAFQVQISPGVYKIVVAKDWEILGAILGDHELFPVSAVVLGELL